MNQIITDLGIDESLTRPTKKLKSFTHVKDMVPPKEHYNYMADLLFLPETTKGYKYCLVVVDLANDEFDIEPIKNKEPQTVLDALKEMYKRPYIKEPYSSIKTDAGNEFKGVFQNYLYNESIYHSVARPGRHKQLSNVEALNRQLGRLFRGYMNKIEMETKKSYSNWTDVLSIVRDRLNKFRKKKIVSREPYFDLESNNKYNIGDIVYVKLEKPEGALGQQLSGEKFREGDFRYDTTPRKVTNVFYYPGAVPYRYSVSGIKGVSFDERELIPADEKEEEYEVKKFIDRKKERNTIYFLVWWKGYPKKEATWESRTSLNKYVPELVKEYDKNFK